MSDAQNLFTIDHALESTCIELFDAPLSRIFLKNIRDYPWFILVPRVSNLTEWMDLAPALQHQLADEISGVSLILRRVFAPDKINLASLGNQVRQLHIHILGRFGDDPLWPHGVWQASAAGVNYPLEALKNWTELLKEECAQVFLY